MHLLYEKEYSDKVKEEQRRLLAWIKETVKLNPQSDINSILLAADGYVSYSSLTVEKRRSAVVPAEENVVIDSELVDEVDAESVDEDGDAPLLAEEPEPLPHDEVIVENFTPESEETEEESTPVDEFETENDVDEESLPELVDEEPTADEENVPEETVVSYDDEELKHISDIDEFFTPAQLPSREEEEAEEAIKESQNKQMQLRDRHAAIFSDRTEIENL